MILNLTPTAHPRTFRRLIDLSFTSQGYKDFITLNQRDRTW